MIGIAGIVLSLALLMFFAYRGVSVLVLAPLTALLAVAFAGGGAPVMASYTQVFMAAAGNFVATYFPLFLLGALFGKLMADSGLAAAIARWIVARTGAARAVLAVVLACAVLTYGGVSLFVVAFAIYPIAAALFREADVPKRLIPGAIALGSFTFTMTALPGTPAIQNLIPMPFFGTDAFAAPGLGCVAASIMFAGGTAWLTWRRRRARAAGEGYGEHPGETPSLAAGPAAAPAPAHPLLAFTPVVLVIVLNYAFSNYVIPAVDTGYLAEPRYGATTVDKVKGTWAIVAALAAACAAVLVLRWGQIRDVRRTVNEGAAGSLLPIFNTASEVGYGAVIASLAAFVIVRDFVFGIAPGNPLISLAVAVNALAGITGSASGGMSIALSTLGPTYAARGAAAGVSPELMHRVTSIASGGFDTLPHNGAVITLLTICGLTHRQSYADVFVVSLVVPVLALVAVIALGTAFGSF